jgi:hypothetical protein
MTAIYRNGEESPFSKWIRNHPDLDSIKERLCVQDQDYWIHQYRAHHDRIGSRAVDSLMCLETKTFSAGIRFAQRDTLFLIDQLLRTSRTGQRSYRRCRGPNGEVRIVRSFGVIPLCLSGSRPDDSEEILWNGRKINEPMLVELLRFERDPHCPSKQLEYRRHHLPSIVQLHPTLFEAAG